MTYTLANSTNASLGSRTGYKWIPAGATYEPCDPYPGLGRFGDGSYRTLYVADSAQGALAEYFRRNPELFSFQDDLVIQMFELDLQIQDPCLATTAVGCCAAIGFDESRLSSNEADEDIRYAECRQLAFECVAAAFVGILYPSASATWGGAYNLVLFNEQSSATWECPEHRSVPLPRLSESDFVPL